MFPLTKIVVSLVIIYSKSLHLYHLKHRNSENQALNKDTSGNDDGKPSRHYFKTFRR